LKKQLSPELIEESLLAAMRRLRAELGPGPAWWSWGEFRPLHLKHILLGKSKLLGPVFNFARVPHGGDHYTVNQSGACLRDLRRPVTNLPNLRAVFDCGNWSNSRVILCGGQSGNPFSPHYADMFPLWQQGQTVPLPYTVEDVLQASKSTLRVLPSA